MAVVKEMFEDIHDRIDAGPTSIAATIIGDGSISNTEFQYLNNASSNIQAQIDGITAGTSQTIVITVKVADDGSGSQDITLLSGTDTGAGTRSANFIFQLGFKYKFDLSDSSLSGHNFKFSTTRDGSQAGGSEFANVTSDGTPETVMLIIK